MACPPASLRPSAKVAMLMPAWPNVLPSVPTKPGFVGTLGNTFGQAGINIATFALGRREAGGHAIALVEIDAPITPEILAKVQGIKNVIEAKALRF